MPNTGRVPMAPPVLEYLGALTLRDVPGSEVRLVDAAVTTYDPEAEDADLVGISAMTATVTWAYATADRLRERGIPVVLGGIHVTALPDEAALHADAVVVGEAESVWAQCLADAEAGQLQARYVGERLTLDDLPVPLFGRLEGEYKSRGVITARGCPYRCTFCSVRTFFGDTIRYRPIEDVVAEVKALPGMWYLNCDDNIWGGDPERTIALFEALAAEAPMPWYGFSDLKAVQGPYGERLIKAAKASGLFAVWVGYETVDVEALEHYHATGKQGNDRERAIRMLQDAGIEVVLFLMVGGRDETVEDFRKTIETVDRLKVGSHPVLLTPLPGTELFEEYRPYLLPGVGWDRFDGTHAVFEHPDPRLTPAARERRYYEMTLQLMEWRRFVRHLSAVSWKGFPRVHFLALMKHIPVKRAMTAAWQAWQKENTGQEARPASQRVQGRR